MNQSVVMKMVCHDTPAEADISSAPQQVRFGAVWEPDKGERDKAENAVFGNATPWGELRAAIANPDAKRLLKPGRAYYITITEAPD